jgi:outer membrane immunogenic protein
MRNSKLAVAAFAISGLLSVGVASAADLPARTYTKAPAVVEPLFSWTGFYIGADVGYGWATSSGLGFNAAFTPGSGPAYSYHPSGVMGGGFVGGNYQFDKVVVGVEADWQAASLSANSGQIFNAFGTGYLFSTKITDYGSVRGRLGLALDRWMIFGTAGAAWGSWSTSYSGFGAPSPFYTNTVNEHMGWTAGAGVEYAVTNNWLLRGEYRYTDLRTSSYVSATANAADANHVTVNDIRFGVAYKFGGPVVAKY